MGRKNSQYTPEFRAMAANEVIDRSCSIAGVARQLGIVEQILGELGDTSHQERTPDEMRALVRGQSVRH